MCEDSKKCRWTKKHYKQTKRNKSNNNNNNMWNMKVTIIPIGIGALGIVIKGSAQGVEDR